MKRRRFLRAFALSAGGIFVPRIIRAPPGLPYFTVPLSTPASASNGLLASIVGYWKLDDVTTGAGFVWSDATGHNWGATQQAGFITHDASVFEIVASAKNLTSTQDGLQISANIDMRAGTTPFTISCWVNGNANAFASNCVAFDNITNRNWSLYASNSSGGSGTGWISLQTWRTGGTYDNSITAATAMTGGSVFDHILAGYDGTNRFIIQNNGTKVTSAVPSVARGLAPMSLMTRGDNLAGWVLGRLDEVAYFNADMSSKASLLYNGGAGLPFSSYS